MKNLIAFLLIVVQITAGQSQTALPGQSKYFIAFKDKKGVEIDPFEFYDPKAIERRIKHNIPLVTFSDLPVNTSYVQSIENIADSVEGTTRWLNGVFVSATQDQVAAIRKLGFVRKTEGIQFRECKLAANSTDIELFVNEEKLAKKQMKRHGIEHFRKQNIDGSGVRVAVFDAGFPDVDEHRAFKHLFANNRIKGTHDFVRDKPDVYKRSAHGTAVLSNIAGRINGHDMGLATGAEFLLARTERAIFEPFSEEKNWLMAAEWADKNGADIISSSLGYTSKRYSPEEMDGHTSFVSEAARFAVRKGMLVVNAAGNEGNDYWETIGTPADVDSVLSVGGISPESDYHINFSSFGPTSTHVMKPNVCSYGMAAVASRNNDYKIQFGTSFATPIVSGFAACVMQMKPGFTNMEVFNELERAGHLYPYFDYAHGFGVPQAAHFTQGKKPVKPTFNITDNGREIVIRVKEFKTKLEQKQDSSFSSKHYLYYHFENAEGYLSRYSVVEVTSEIPVSFLKSDIKNFAVLRAHYNGYTITKDIKTIEPVAP